MDIFSYRGYKYWLQKGLICIEIDESDFIDLWIQIRESDPKRFRFEDSIRDLNFQRFGLFHESNESSLHRRTLNKLESLLILGLGFANPHCFQKIRFVDSNRFGGFVYKSR